MFSHHSNGNQEAVRRGNWALNSKLAYGCIRKHIIFLWESSLWLTAAVRSNVLNHEYIARTIVAHIRKLLFLWMETQWCGCAVMADDPMVLERPEYSVGKHWSHWSHFQGGIWDSAQSLYRNAEVDMFTHSSSLSQSLHHRDILATPLGLDVVVHAPGTTQCCCVPLQMVHTSHCLC